MTQPVPVQPHGEWSLIITFDKPFEVEIDRKTGVTRITLGFSTQEQAARALTDCRVSVQPTNDLHPVLAGEVIQ